MCGATRLHLSHQSALDMPSNTALTDNKGTDWLEALLYIRARRKVSACPGWPGSPRKQGTSSLENTFIKRLGVPPIVEKQMVGKMRI